MANRQVYPSSLFPLRGDISAEAGAVAVVVIGLQTIPVESGVPSGPDALVYNPSLGQWTQVLLDGSLLVNGVPVSDDYVFTVNNAGMEALVAWAYGFAYKAFVNGTGFVGS
jgi:hypothetical protein